MSVKITAIYIGDDRVELIHDSTGNKIITDLPIDNGGKGRTFSPTDLVAAALASCILTIMAKVAAKENIDIQHTSITIEKEMANNPRRISKLYGKIRFATDLPQDKKEKLISVIKSCPVTKSLNPEIEISFDIVC